MTNPISAIRWVRDGELRYDALTFVCPGCKLMWDGGDGFHMLPVNSTEKTPAWDWDGNLEAPTLSPSILTKTGVGGICHSFIREGVIEFLTDSTHALAGEKVPLPPLEDWMLK